MLCNTMQTVVADYSNTIFYKISCKDAAIADLYIGHTINFVQRKYAHKQGCNNPNVASYNLKLYNVIRQNGGWDNWRMDIVAHHECKDLRDARTKEQEYFISYKATLNSIEPMPTATYHTASMPNVQPTNAVWNFECKKCEYHTSNKKDYNKHLLTQKHLHDQKQQTTETPKREYLCDCGKQYTHRASLWNHKKHCDFQCNEHCDDDLHIPIPQSTNVTNSLINELIKHNNDLKELMMEQSKQFAEQQTQILEAIRVGVVSNNNK
jgi:hypothetical protein